MKSFSRVVSIALKDVRAEAVRLGAALGFDWRSVVEETTAELSAWEAARGVRAPLAGRIRAVFALANILDPMIPGEEGDWVETIDREFAILKRFAESKRPGQRVAA